MSNYGMCPYVLYILHSTRFWYKRRGFAVININIISYLVDTSIVRSNQETKITPVPCYCTM